LKIQASSVCSFSLGDETHPRIPVRFVFDRRGCPPGQFKTLSEWDTLPGGRLIIAATARQGRTCPHVILNEVKNPPRIDQPLGRGFFGCASE